MFFNAQNLFLLLFVLCFFACKKEPEDEKNSENTALKLRLALIQQHWDFDLFVHRETVGMTTSYDSVKGVAGDFFDFRKDNKVYAHWGGLPDTVDYVLADINSLVYAGDTFKITMLASDKFVLSRSIMTDSASSIFDELKLSR